MTQLYCVVYREEKDLIEFHLFKHDWSDSSVGNFPIKLNFHRIMQLSLELYGA